MFTQCLAQQATNTMYYFYSHIVDSCWSQEYYASEEKKAEQSALGCLASNFLLCLVVFMIILLARRYLIAHAMKFKNVCFGSISSEATLKL